MYDNMRKHAPWWMAILLLLMLSPLWHILDLCLHAAIVTENTEIVLIAKLLPVYAVITVVCIYLAYPRNKTCAYILLTLLAMSYAGLYWWAKTILE